MNAKSIFPQRHKFVGIIPARLQSTRLSNKLLLPLGDKSILQRTYEQAIKCKSLSSVYIATDSEEIINHAYSFTNNILRTTSKPNSGTERIIEAIEKLPLTSDDVVINIQGDEPFMPVEAIEDLLSVFKTTLCEIATLARPCVDDKEFYEHSSVKVVVNRNNYALYFSRAPIPYPRNDVGSAYIHAGIYGYTIGALRRIATMGESLLEQRESLEQLKWMDYGEKIYVKIGNYKFFGIDTLEDYRRAQRMI